MMNILPPRFTTTCFALLAALAPMTLVACSDDPPAAQRDPAIPAPSIAVDETLEPSTPTIAGLREGDPARPVAVLEGPSGRRLEFVANELIAAVESLDQAQALAERHGGAVISSWDVPGPEGDLLIALLRIAPSGLDTATVPTLAGVIDPQASGEARVSSPEALQLIAALAQAMADDGLSAGLNPLLASDGIRERTTNDGPTSDGPNAFDWPQLQQGGVFDTGVAEAWRVLDEAGRLDNRVTVAVLDGGFSQVADMPENMQMYPPQGWERENPARCSGDTVCRWHGTDTARVLAAPVDNGEGGAGTGAPVVDLIGISSPSDFFSGIDYAFNGVLPALGRGPRVVNISASTGIDAGWAWAVGPVLHLIAAGVKEAGLLVVASAGNAAGDVDNRDCFGDICWEGALHIPCELEGVVCVGGLFDRDVGVPHPMSNWGSAQDANSVDIFAPWDNWVAPDLDNPNIHLANGTSAAAPFVSGVLALILAADPSLSVRQAEQILLQTAHTHATDERVGRWVDALGAVRRALGDDAPPYLEIIAPDAEQMVSEAAFVGLVAHVEDEDVSEVIVSWSSDVDGDLGQGRSTNARLSAGPHVITATASDDRWTVERSVSIEILDEAPVVSIVLPIDDAVELFAGQTLYLSASSHDAATWRPFPEDQIEWLVDDVAFDTGHSTTLTLDEPGTYEVQVVASDGTSTQHDTVSVDVLLAPEDLPPEPIITNPDVLDYDAGIVGPGGSVEVAFSGMALDPEDGELDPSSLRWTMQRLGSAERTVFGTGTSALGTFEESGEGTLTTYVVELEAEDSAGNIQGYSMLVRVTTLI